MQWQMTVEPKEGWVQAHGYLHAGGDVYDEGDVQCLALVLDDADPPAQRLAVC